VAFGDQDRALITVVPHTTSLRDSTFEVAVQAPFLKPGAFLVQGVTTFPIVRAMHRLGSLQTNTFQKVMAGVMRWLGC
jgi:mRNA interferase MazF